METEYIYKDWARFQILGVCPKPRIGTDFKTRPIKKDTSQVYFFVFWALEWNYNDFDTKGNVTIRYDTIEVENRL